MFVNTERQHIPLSALESLCANNDEKIIQNVNSESEESHRQHHVTTTLDTGDDCLLDNQETAVVMDKHHLDHRQAYICEEHSGANREPNEEDQTSIINNNNKSFITIEESNILHTTFDSNIKSKSIAPSRYIRAIRHQWDQRLELNDLILNFREAITCILKYATKHLSLSQEKIIESFEGNTRSKFREIRRLERLEHLDDLNHESCQKKTDQMTSTDYNEIEAVADLLKKVTQKCNEILDELSTHNGTYTERFKKMVESVIKEVNKVNWSSLTDEQAIEILTSPKVTGGLPTFHMEELLMCAIEIPPVTCMIDDLKFNINELGCWTPVVQREELKVPSYLNTITKEKDQSNKTTDSSTVEIITDTLQSERDGQVIVNDENILILSDGKKEKNGNCSTPSDVSQPAVHPKRNSISLNPHSFRYVCAGGAPPFTFRVTASCYDHTKVILTRLYLGTHSGAIISLPFDGVVVDKSLTTCYSTDLGDIKKNEPIGTATYPKSGAMENVRIDVQDKTEGEIFHTTLNDGVINNITNEGAKKKIDFQFEKSDQPELGLAPINAMTSSSKEGIMTGVAEEKFHSLITELFDHSVPQNETESQRRNRECKEAVQLLLSIYTKDPCAVKNPITINNVILFPGHVYPVTNLVLINEHNIIVSASKDKTLRFYNSKTGHVLNVVANTNGAPSSCVYYNPLKAIAVVTYSGTIEFIDPKTSHFAGRIRVSQPIHCVVVDPYTDILFVGTRKGHIYGFRLSVDHRHKTPKLNPLFDEGQRQDCCYCFVPDNYSLAYPVNCDVYTITTGGHSTPVTTITPISGFLFTGDDYGKILQWDLQSSKLVRKYHSHSDTITSITVAGDGFMFSSAKDALIIIWNVADGNVIRRINRHYHRVTGVFLGYLAVLEHSQGLCTPNDGGKNRKTTQSDIVHKDDICAIDDTESLHTLRSENHICQDHNNNKLSTPISHKDNDVTHLIGSNNSCITPAHPQGHICDHYMHTVGVVSMDSVTTDNCVGSRENISVSMRNTTPLMISVSEDGSVVTWSVNYRT